MTLRRKRKWSSSLPLSSSISDLSSFLIVLSTLCLPEKNEGIGTTVVMISAMILREKSQKVCVTSAFSERGRGREIGFFQRVFGRLKKKRRRNWKKKKGGKRKEKERSVIDRVDIETTNAPPSCQLADWWT